MSITIEGFISDVDGDRVWLRFDAVGDEWEAEVSITQFTPNDRPEVVAGRLFRWTAPGPIELPTEPRWTAEDLAAAKAEAAKMAEWFAQMEEACDELTQEAQALGMYDDEEAG